MSRERVVENGQYVLIEIQLKLKIIARVINLPVANRQMFFKIQL